MIASPPAVSSCLPLSYCTTLLMGCPQTQHTHTSHHQIIVFSSFCKIHIYIFSIPYNVPKRPFRENVVLHDVAHKLHIVYTYHPCQPFLGWRIDFLPSRHLLVSAHLLEIGNPSQWTVRRLAFWQNYIIFASGYCFGYSLQWCVQGHLEVCAR